MKRRPPTKITDELRKIISDLYVGSNKPGGEIAKELGVGIRTVYRCLRQSGIVILRGQRSKDPEHLAVSGDLPTEERRRRRLANLSRWIKNNPEKNRLYNKKYRENNPEKTRIRNQAWSRKRRNDPKRKEQIKKWREVNKEQNKEQRRDYGRHYARTERRRATMQQWKIRNRSNPSNRLRYLIKAAQRRCASNGFAFELGLYELMPPEGCMCCGAAIDYSGITSRSRYRRSMSLDRLVPRDGYTVANTRIICTRCNIAKSDTSLDELKLLVAYVERELAARQHNESEKQPK